MTNAEVERVARALFEFDQQLENESGVQNWDDDWEDTKEIYRTMAVVALRAAHDDKPAKPRTIQ